MGLSEIITLAFFGWLILNLATLFIAMPTMGQTPMPWQVFRMVHECAGAVLRKVRKKPSYKSTMDAFQILGINPHTSSTKDVPAARDRILNEMRKQPWTYPLSQRDAITWMADSATWRLAYRDIAEQVRQEELRWKREAERAREQQRKAQADMEKEFARLDEEERKWHAEYERSSRAQREQAKANRTKTARPTSSGWRHVLGVSDSERNTQVIKQAYRKRALTAHPDRGGSNEAMATLNRAIDQARKELSFV